MFAINLLKSVLIATGFLVLMAGGVAVSSESHSHDYEVSESTQLQLNHGEKWEGDDHLRRAMNTVGAELNIHLAAIHEDSFTDEQYKTLAAEIQLELDYIIDTCELPQAEDEQLHLVVVPMVGWAAEMAEGNEPRDHAVKMIKASNNYAKFFKHPEWVPIGASQKH